MSRRTSTSPARTRPARPIGGVKATPKVAEVPASTAAARTAVQGMSAALERLRQFAFNLARRSGSSCSRLSPTGLSTPRCETDQGGCHAVAHGCLVALAPGASPGPQSAGAEVTASNRRHGAGRRGVAGRHARRPCDRDRSPRRTRPGATPQSNTTATGSWRRRPTTARHARGGRSPPFRPDLRSAMSRTPGPSRGTLRRKDGSNIDIWVDGHGRQVGPPTPSWQAGADAVVTGVGIWLSVPATAALLVALVRRCLKHARYAGWNRDIASLVHDDGGRTNRHQ